MKIRKPPSTFLNQVDDADLAALTEEGANTGRNARCLHLYGEMRSRCGRYKLPCLLRQYDGMWRLKSRNPRKKRPRRRNPKKAAGLNPAVLLLVLALMGGIGAVIYLKFIRKKPQTTATHDPERL